MKLKTLFPAVGIVLSLALSGCSSTDTINAPSSPNEVGNLLLTEPLPVSVRSQMALARLNHILAQVEQISDEQRAELLYQRGTLYDSVGLRGLAQFDFETALKFKPDMAEAHNFVGINHTQNSEFVEAYDSFDSTLEIQPDHDYALLNRGIALYYGGRSELGVKDLKRFYDKKQSDPYRVLWYYIVESDNDLDQANAFLKTARTKLSESNWATWIVDFYLGEITESELVTYLFAGVTSQEQLIKRFCEAYFYLGKYYVANEKPGQASNYFKLTLSTNVYDYVEHRYARLELNLLREQKYN